MKKRQGVRRSKRLLLIAGCVATTSLFPSCSLFVPDSPFLLQEATIADTQKAIKTGQITVTELVHLYLNRIKAYNGVCVNQPEGILGPISTIPNAGQINALSTLNLRPHTRKAMEFDDRKARSMTDPVDNDPNMPDALEVAAALDAEFARTGELAGPLHGVVFSIKDAYDTFDMRTTSGADAFYANDRPPDDATVVKRLRDAGAIILAKANMAEYQGATPRSSFGGTFCNPYDTERDPGISSSGSGTSVAANLVTCSIAEETGGSVIMPSRMNSVVGLVPTRELVSADGMIEQGIDTRVGPICRTVQDVARVLDVYAGYDQKDELTAFSVGRMPSQPYDSFVVDEEVLSGESKPLDGVRIGVVREFMDKSLFTQADFETIDIIDREIDVLRGLGATIADPGADGALFQDCVDKYSPVWHNRLFIGQFPDLFSPSTDHIPLLVDMFLDPSLVPHTETGRPSIRRLGPGGENTGTSRFNFNWYLQERGDSNIRSLTDLIDKANFHLSTAALPNRLVAWSLPSLDSALTHATQGVLQNRFADQTVVLQCFAQLGLDAVTFPSGNIPPKILTNPSEPIVNHRDQWTWGSLGSRGFPEISVPAGFTTQVFDRVYDPSAPELPIAWEGAARTRLVGPIPAELPVGISFLCRPFGEPKCLQIASAYEAATHHRIPPHDFGPLPGEPQMRANIR